MAPKASVNVWFVILVAAHCYDWKLVSQFGRRLAIVVALGVLALTGLTSLASWRRTLTWGWVLIAGGENSNSFSLASVELYDPLSGSLAFSTPAMCTPRGSATTTLLATGPNTGKVLIAGGGNDSFSFRCGTLASLGTLASTELYDPAANRFTRGPDMMQAREAHTATVITVGPNAGKILFAGGGNGNSPYTLASTEIYDPVVNTFAAGPEMKTRRQWHTATVIPLGPNRGKILIAGGSNYENLSSTELYDPVANTVSPGPNMNAERAFHTATGITSGPNSGKILFAGGNNELVSTELYDPAVNMFVKGPDLKVPRVGHTATEITSGPNKGKVLLVGGGNHESTLASTELYDPASDTFAPSAATATLNIPRILHAATVIGVGPNAGKVLIAGGGNTDQKGNFQLLTSTELYDPATNTFAPGPAMSTGRRFAAAIQLPSAPSTSATGP